MQAETAILNLLYTYAEHMDLGELPQAAELFRDAQIMVVGSDCPIDHVALLEAWRQNVRIYPCGTPRTRHIVTNPIITIAADGRSADCRSCYTVLQSTDDLPLQVVITGRYHDRFVCKEGTWRFAFRDYRLIDLVGDLGAHLLLPLER